MCYVMKLKYFIQPSANVSVDISYNNSSIFQGNLYMSLFLFNYLIWHEKCFITVKNRQIYQARLQTLIMQSNKKAMIVKKLNLMKLVAATGLLILSTASWSLTINSGATQVGDVDELIGSANLWNSSKAAEEKWVEATLGFDVVLEFKNDGEFNWSKVDDTSSIFAQELSTDPDYFLVKIGTGGIAGLMSHHLYKNMYELGYAVINLAQIAPKGVTIDIARVSHISEFSVTKQVPEPGSLALLGLGLLGLGLFRRKAK